MTKNSETVKEEDLIQRKDGLYYKKYAKVPFTGSMKIFRKVDPNGQSRVNSQTWEKINYKKGKPVSENRVKKICFIDLIPFTRPVTYE